MIYDNKSISDFNKKANSLLIKMKQLFLENDIPLSVNAKGGMFGFFFSKNLPKNLNDVVSTNDKHFNSFLNKCIGEGIYFAPSKFEAGFISTKHTKLEINHTINVIKKILQKGI